MSLLFMKGVKQDFDLRHCYDIVATLLRHWLRTNHLIDGKILVETVLHTTIINLVIHLCYCKRCNLHLLCSLIHEST